MSKINPLEPATTSKIPINSNVPEGTRYPFLAPAEQPDELGRLGDYRVLRLVGTGGMGMVFEAEEVTLARRVALKVLLPELANDAENRKRFLREARAAAAVESDHVVTIYYVASSELPYLAMQFLEGETLQARIDRQPPLTLRDALEIARQTAKGLAAAHEKGLVHRDIKPANLWLETTKSPDRGTPTDKCDDKSDSHSGVRTPGPGFRVKILDFGLARLASGETSLTSTGLVVGTPNYMSPEQAAGLDLDGRSDLFSLGCVLYAMLVGNLPFPGNTAMAVMMSLATKTPPRVDERNPEIPSEVADLVARLLKKKPHRRPASACEVVAALEDLLLHVRENVSLRSYSSSHSTGNYFLGETLVRLPKSPPPPPSSTEAKVVAQTSVATRRRRGKREKLAWLLLGVIMVGAVGFGLRGLLDAPATPPDPIVIGVLHSQTGTMAVQEGPLIDATLFAIDELNAAGGVLGRPLRAVVVDGKSDPAEFQRAAERLTSEDRVSVIFGCMTSPCRKTVMSVVERDNGLLFYPVSFEGLEQSPRIVYLGAVPNQKHLPAIDYFVKTLGKKRLFVVGSDLVSPRCTTEVIRDHLRYVLRDGEVIDAKFVPFGSSDFTSVAAEIAAAKPDAIINILNGGSNFPFYRELRRHGVTSATPTLSITLTEHDLIGFDPKLVAGDYLAANYFQEIDRSENRAFLAKVKERFGDQRVVTDNMTAAYSGVHIWAKAVAKAGTPDPVEVLKAVGGVEFDGPSARLVIDAENHYVWWPWRIGQIRHDGTVRIVSQSPAPVRADPFPATRTRRKWDHLLMNLYIEWGGRWQAPDKK